ncbi:DUF298-domain-containing protein [Sporormia fimetaria CBS 119925]|uniref:Defective in cullin neddylation protein n=1 Tax=Sporormia fimetaria CBS 119925 TaxID=1340428 RepID=A0A6A6V1U7_9PLEO|nr:DUF298-domain-containing protein [Sporormia fimetaria CBS 119925]
MPAAYSNSQKASIAQFQALAQTDRATAARYLKSENWDEQRALNAYFSGGNANATPRSASGLKKIFEKYREDAKNSPETVGVEGTMQYLQDIGSDIEGLETLAVLEIVQAPAMGEMTLAGFVNGWSALNCDTLDKQRAHIQNLKQTLPSQPDTFSKIYTYTFQLAITGQQRAIPLEAAVAYWELLFTSPLSALKWSTPSSPFITWWIEFLNTVWKRSINKDIWGQTLKFAKLTLQDERLGFWSEESSWPSVIDEFVEWVKKEKRGEVAEQEASEEY